MIIKIVTDIAIILMFASRNNENAPLAAEDDIFRKNLNYYFFEI